MVCREQTMVWWEQTMVCRRQTKIILYAVCGAAVAWLAQVGIVIPIAKGKPRRMHATLANRRAYSRKP
ncbi:hypothetical protein [Alloprevotella tannerae]|uniref:hypothetical protein n=1 Tax=Alloprevotella tannerae TaxID=76122 RepID=UPI0028E420E5|nr:hypothetical protein [Alloprevotella tannerae]